METRIIHNREVYVDLTDGSMLMRMSLYGIWTMRRYRL